MTPYIPATLRRQVQERARHRCEHCLLPEKVAFYPHEIDHIRADKHGGKTVERNLCWSCWLCNRHKGTDLTSFDPLTDEISPLFNPRVDRWDEHFRLVGAEIEGITALGRATTRMLHFNLPDRVELREELIRMGRYP